jgi:hypothetical protein
MVRELTTQQSPYVVALRQTDDTPDRAAFLCRWADLIAETVDRVLGCSRFDTHRASACSTTVSPGSDVDSRELAVLILAALHGGTALSKLDQDPQPIDAALDLALAHVMAPGGKGPEHNKSA